MPAAPGGAPGPRRHKQARARDGTSALALEHDVCGGGRHRALDYRQRARGLRHRSPALQGRGNGRRLDLLRLSRTAVDPLYSARIGHPGLWSVRLAAVADFGLSDAADSVLDLAVDGIFQD